MAVTMVVAGPWMLKLIVSYTRDLIQGIPGMIR
jgi:flagellar biosynthesis protein FliQ